MNGESSLSFDGKVLDGKTASIRFDGTDSHVVVPDVSSVW